MYTCVKNLVVSFQVATFNELVDQGTDEDSYRALTALGILTAVQSLVKATFNEAKVWRERERGREEREREREREREGRREREGEGRREG